MPSKPKYTNEKRAIERAKALETCLALANESQILDRFADDGKKITIAFAFNFNRYFSTFFIQYYICNTMKKQFLFQNHACFPNLIVVDILVEFYHQSGDD